jgi:predicted peptidase
LFTRSSHSRVLAVLAILGFAGLPAGAVGQERGKVEIRSYHFEEAQRDIEYALFVPKSYDEKKAAPLVVLLHGLNSNPKQVMGYRGITAEAAKRGYIVVAPYGYNGRGWYGSRGKGKKGSFFGRASDPDNLGELSEKDVMNVLGIVREQFAIDADRIYLMGHSMGGAGTVHLGMKYPELWAALAPLAPALDRDTSRLRKMKHLPIKIVTGDKDRLVRVEVVRRWVAEMEKLEIDHEYVEIEGGDHVRAITRNAEMVAGVFDFFDRKRRVPAEDRAEKTAAPKPPKPEPAGAGR